MDEETAENDLNMSHQMALPMKDTSISEVKNVIQQEINAKEASFYILITDKIFLSS